MSRSPTHAKGGPNALTTPERRRAALPNVQAAADLPSCASRPRHNKTTTSDSRPISQKELSSVVADLGGTEAWRKVRRKRASRPAVARQVERADGGSAGRRPHHGLCSIMFRRACLTPRRISESYRDVVTRINWIESVQRNLPYARSFRGGGWHTRSS